jgi:hypothetical protein
MPGVGNNGVMIPQINSYLVLPPFTGVDPISAMSISPYIVLMSDVVQRFATTIERATILRGLLAYRQAVNDLGMTDGYMWLDGSFVKDVETGAGRAPNDIDVVIFTTVPGRNRVAKLRVFKNNPAVFRSGEAKRKYLCDAYFVDLAAPPQTIVANTCYWFGLFSHQRGTGLWKGMLQVPLQSDDAAASVMLRLIEQRLQGAQNAKEAGT